MVVTFPRSGWEANGGGAAVGLPSIAEEAPGESGDAEAPLGADGDEDAVKVVVRVRPPLARELQGFRPFQNAALPNPSKRVVTLSENLAALQNGGVENGLAYSSYRFGFDRVYGPESTQEEVYVESAQGAVQSVLQGYNASIIAYGQADGQGRPGWGPGAQQCQRGGSTGTGKTYTMEGAHEGPGRGIIPRAIEDVFAAIQVGAVGPPPWDHLPLAVLAAAPPARTGGAGPAERRDAAAPAHSPRARADVGMPASFPGAQGAAGEACKFLVRASYLQIYNEVISDLLKPDAVNLVVREDRRRGVHVEGLSEWVVRGPGEVYSLMARGAAARATGATKLNEISSRSHAIFILIVEKSTISGSTDGGTSTGTGTGIGAGLEAFHGLAPGMAGGGAAGAAGALALAGGAGGGGAPGARQSVKVGKLNLVDLAGSERVHVTGATGKRLEESKKINQSLSALGNVIAALTDPKGRDGRPHIPYRDSKLTRILEDSLGGNCRTTFMAMISPAVEAYAESLSTLKFANRAKCVRNLPKVNEDLDHRTLLRRYERELRKLRAELQQKSRDLVDKRLVLQIEEARRREQADKIAAITALERQSQEIMRHKQAMAALQSRIASMQSQLLIGGQKIEDTPQFRWGWPPGPGRGDARRLWTRWVEHLRGLLLKQRDIMIALTGRLNERDEQILGLQAEVEAYDAAQSRKLEDQLDRKTAELIALRKLAVAGGGLGDDAALQQWAPLGADAPQPWAPIGDAPPGSMPRAAAGPQQVVGWADDGSEMGASPAPGLPGAGSEAPSAAAAALQHQLEQLRVQHSREAAALAEGEARWRQAAEALQARLDELTAAAAGRGDAGAGALGAGGGGSSSDDEAAAPAGGAAEARAAALAREREALRTILDTKVGVLVEEVARSAAELPGAAAHPKLGKQLDYLGKLLRATVAAMAGPPPADAGGGRGGARPGRLQ
eukprot:scaffold12.g8052.t1